MVDLVTFTFKHHAKLPQVAFPPMDSMHVEQKHTPHAVQRHTLPLAAVATICLQLTWPHSPPPLPAADRREPKLVLREARCLCSGPTPLGFAPRLAGVSSRCMGGLLAPDVTAQCCCVAELLPAGPDADPELSVRGDSAAELSVRGDSADSLMEPYRYAGS